MAACVFKLLLINKIRKMHNILTTVMVREKVGTFFIRKREEKRKEIFGETERQ